MNVAYVRVSTREQNTDRQMVEMERYNIEKFFVEKQSGKNMNRAQLNEMLGFVREGDTVYVSEFSRLARSTKDLLDIIDALTAKGVKVVSLKESLDTSTATGTLMLTVIAAIATFERQIMLERQRDGIAIAKEKGKFAKEPIKVADDVWNAAYSDYLARRLSKAGMCKVLGISRPTLNRIMKEKGVYVEPTLLTGAAAASVAKSKEVCV